MYYLVHHMDTSQHDSHSLRGQVCHFYLDGQAGRTSDKNGADLHLLHQVAYDCPHVT